MGRSCVSFAGLFSYFNGLPGAFLGHELSVGCCSGFYPEK
ncbi:hypothetical protein [Methylomonas albis]|nr:hypothetical protein [Methylomonas albis]